MQNHVMGNSVDKTMNDIRVCTARASFALNSHKVYYKSYKNAIFDDRLSDFWLLQAKAVIWCELSISFPKAKKGRELGSTEREVKI